MSSTRLAIGLRNSQTFPRLLSTRSTATAKPTACLAALSDLGLEPAELAQHHLGAVAAVPQVAVVNVARRGLGSGLSTKAATLRTALPSPAGWARI
jgi:hypothetical protein